MRNARGGGGFVQRVGLVMAALAILALTFTLGILVGRQWGGGGAPTPSVEAARKPAIAARRSGLMEAEAERPREAVMSESISGGFGLSFGTMASGPLLTTSGGSAY